MKQYTVIFTPEAQEQLLSLYRYIAAAASPEIAERYTSAIVAYCENLKEFPLRQDQTIRMYFAISRCLPSGIASALPVTLCL